MENLLCFFTTHIMIAYSAARGKERKVENVTLIKNAQTFEKGA